MTRLKKRILIAAGVAVATIAAALVVPSMSRGDIVFDPANFIEAVSQVADDVQLVEQFQQEIHNQLAMLQNWGYSQLSGIIQSMDVWQQVFGQAGATYSSTDPGQTLDSEYPSEPASYANTSDAAMASTRDGWNQEQRSVLIENRTVQDQTYLNLQPTADRIQDYVEHSNSAPGATAALQAGNEELATLVAQLQGLQAQEITSARGDVEQMAQDQADQAYAEQQRQAVRADWSDPVQPSSSLLNAFPGADQ